VFISITQVVSSRIEQYWCLHKQNATHSRKKKTPSWNCIFYLDIQCGSISLWM